MPTLSNILDSSNDREAPNAAPASPPRRASSRLVRSLKWIVPIVIVAGIAGYGTFWRYHLKRFQTIREGVFYRVAQPTEIGMRHLVKHHGIKTVVSLQLFDFRLHGGLLDPGSPDGRKEAEFTESLGAHHVQWPMGTEKSWPWLTPWQLEEFLRLVDDPANHPIIVHCMGGRHRTGTLSALYRLEYDGWKPEDALREMYSFNFGHPINCQEHNLTTYVRRGRPTADQWASLKTHFAPALVGPAATDYDALVRALRNAPVDGAAMSEAQRYVATGKPFAVTLAERIIDGPSHPLAADAAELARTKLDNHARSPDGSDAAEVVSAAAILADFGGAEEQQHLLELLRTHGSTAAPTPFYESLVRGVTNRYTPNRIAFLRPLLDDRRQRIGPSTKRYRYCDTAVIRLAAITDSLATAGWSEEHVANNGRDIALKWFEEHADAAKLTTLQPPIGRNVVQLGEGPQEEDLSRMRR